MIASIPRRNLADAILDSCRGPEIDVAGKVIGVSIGRRDVAGLHRQQLPFGLASQFLFKDRNDLAEQRYYAMLEQPAMAA